MTLPSKRRVETMIWICVSDKHEKSALRHKKSQKGRHEDGGVTRDNDWLNNEIYGGIRV